MLEEKMRDFRVKWGICKEKTSVFRDKWGICEEKTRNIRLNGGFSKRTCDFRLNVVFLKRIHVILGLNGGFSKRKRVIFA